MLGDLLRCGGGLFSVRHDVGGLVVSEDAKVGEGGFASVWRCRVISGRGPDGEVPPPLVALKKSVSEDSERRQLALGEAEVMRRALEEKGRGSEYITRYWGHAEVPATRGFDREVHLLLEWCPGGSLLDRILGPSGLPVGQARFPNMAEAEIARVLRELASGLGFLHSCLGVVHYDLKPENVLFSDEGAVRLCDFGSASTKQWPNFSAETPRSVVKEVALFLEGRSTPMFRPPELADPELARLPITTKVDIFTLGLCLYQMLFAVHAFPADGQLANLQANYSVPRGAEKAYSQAMLSALKALLQRDPQERPGVEELTGMCLVLAGPPPGREEAAAAPVAAPTAATAAAGHRGSPTRALPLPKGASAYSGTMSHPRLGQQMALQLNVQCVDGRCRGTWSTLGQTEQVEAELVSEGRLRIANISGGDRTELIAAPTTDGILRGDVLQNGEGGGHFELRPIHRPPAAHPEHRGADVGAQPAPHSPPSRRAPSSPLPAPHSGLREGMPAAVTVPVSGRVSVFSQSRECWFLGEAAALVLSGGLLQDPSCALRTPAPAGSLRVCFQGPGVSSSTKVIAPDAFAKLLRSVDAAVPWVLPLHGEVSVFSRSKGEWYPGHFVRIAIAPGRTDAGEPLLPGAVHVLCSLGAEMRGSKWLRLEDLGSCLRGVDAARVLSPKS